MLHDMALVPGYLFGLPCNEYALTLALVLRLHNQRDPCPARLLLRDEVIEIEELIGCDPSFREESIVLREALLHQLQVFGQVVLQGDQVHGREVVDDLVGLHPLKFLGREDLVSP